MISTEVNSFLCCVPSTEEDMMNIRNGIARINPQTIKESLEEHAEYFEQLAKILRDSAADPRKIAALTKKYS